jgi:transposase
MGEVSTIGLDIAKSAFQVHGVDVAGSVVIRRRISRAKVLEYFGELPRCLVGIEACPSAHHWGRELQALGHLVRLIPPSYVKAYLKRSKNDANDAAATPPFHYGPWPTRLNIVRWRTSNCRVRCSIKTAFGSGRSLAAWIGLVPKQHTTGGKDRLGSITKQGNRYLRWLLVGAMAVIRYTHKHGTVERPWLGRLMERRPTKVAAVALANKIARMAWAIIVRDERYKEPKLLLAP